MKWQGWAQERSMNVEFVWWGEHELTNILTEPRHMGRRQFWFGQIGLDRDWFQRRIEEATKAAGPRYTPEIHVDLPIARKFDLFGRTASSLDEIKSLDKDIHWGLSHIASPGRDVATACPVVPFHNMIETMEMVWGELVALEPLPAGEIPFSKIVLRAGAAITAADKAMDVLSHLYDNYDIKQHSQSIYYNPFAEVITHVQRIRSTLYQVKNTASEADEFANNGLIILKGDAGSGKTHLLCDLAKRRIEAEAPTVLLMGQRFTEQSEPWQQALQHLHLPGASAEEFVGALEASAQAYGKRALFVIDAVNEGRGREIWSAHLSAFLGCVVKTTGGW